jgi:hypothetical protein
MMTVSEVPEAGTKLRIQNHASLDEIVFGRGNRDHVDVLINMCNTAEAIAKLFPSKGGDWMPEIKESQDAVYNMARRGVEKGSFVFTGEELQAIKIVMEVHDQQIEETTVKEIEKAIDYVAECIRLKKVRVILRKEIA